MASGWLYREMRGCNKIARTTAVSVLPEVHVTMTYLPYCNACAAGRYRSHLLPEAFQLASMLPVRGQHDFHSHRPAFPCSCKQAQLVNTLTPAFA